MTSYVTDNAGDMSLCNGYAVIEKWGVHLYNMSTCLQLRVLIKK